MKHRYWMLLLIAGLATLPLFLRPVSDTPHTTASQNHTPAINTRQPADGWHQTASRRLIPVEGVTMRTDDPIAIMEETDGQITRRFVADHALVRLAPETSIPELQQRLATSDFSIRQSFSPTLHTISWPHPDENWENRASALHRILPSAVIQKDALFQPCSDEAVEIATLQPDRTGFVDAVADGWTADGIVVAVIDTGVYTDHPDLQNVMWSNSRETVDGIDNDGNGYIDDVHGYNFASGNPDLSDLNGHGTAMSAIIAADSQNGSGTTGIAPGSRIMALRVHDEKNLITAGSIVSAIEYATHMNADIINLSLGTYVEDDGLIMSQAISDFIAQGGILVTAAGNDGRSLDEHPYYPACLDIDSIVVAGGLENSSNDLYPDGNYSTTHVDILVPAYATVQFADENIQMVDGTSVSAAVLSGIYALAALQFPDSSADDLRLRVLETAQFAPELRRVARYQGYPSYERLKANKRQGAPHLLDLAISPDRDAYFVGEYLECTLTLSNENARVEWIGPTKSSFYVQQQDTGEAHVYRGSQLLTEGADYVIQISTLEGVIDVKPIDSLPQRAAPHFNISGAFPGIVHLDGSSDYKALTPEIVGTRPMEVRWFDQYGLTSSSPSHRIGNSPFNTGTFSVTASNEDGTLEQDIIALWNGRHPPEEHALRTGSLTPAGTTVMQSSGTNRWILNEEGWSSASIPTGVYPGSFVGQIGSMSIFDPYRPYLTTDGQSSHTIPLNIDPDSLTFFKNRYLFARQNSIYELALDGSEIFVATIHDADSSIRVLCGGDERIVAFTSDSKGYVSGDAENWQSIGSALDFPPTQVVYAGDRFFAFGYRMVATAETGVEWSATVTMPLLQQPVFIWNGNAVTTRDNEVIRLNAETLQWETLIARNSDAIIRGVVADRLVLSDSIHTPEGVIEVIDETNEVVANSSGFFISTPDAVFFWDTVNDVIQLSEGRFLMTSIRDKVFLLTDDKLIQGYSGHQLETLALDPIPDWDQIRGIKALTEQVVCMNAVSKARMLDLNGSIPVTQEWKDGAWFNGIYAINAVGRVLSYRSGQWHDAGLGDVYQLHASERYLYAINAPKIWRSADGNFWESFPTPVQSGWKTVSVPGKFGIQSQSTVYWLINDTWQQGAPLESKGPVKETGTLGFSLLYSSFTPHVFQDYRSAGDNAYEAFPNLRFQALDAWFVEPSIGWMWIDNTSPYLWSQQHGWWYVTESHAARHVVYDLKLGWIQADPDRYPLIYRFDTGSWLQYLENTSAPRWFYDFGQAEWISID